MKMHRNIISNVIWFFFFFLILYGFNSATAPNHRLEIINTNETMSQLWTDNIQLRTNYITLQNRINAMEKNIRKINEYDTYLYSELTGVTLDSTIYDIKYSNENISNSQADSIISTIDSRSLYVAKMLSLQLNSLEVKAVNKKNVNSYPDMSPIKTIDFICVSDMYGWRIHPIYKTPLFHEGVDISADRGSSVYSTADGKVIDIVYSNYGYGNKILIKHSSGYETLYAHLSRINVKLGQRVKKNQLIGKVGNSGTSTGNHLHYEIHYKNETKNPLAYFYTYLGNEIASNDKR